ncbi:MAG: hypothetical protein IKW85_05515 [Muribaculaceae bacterium]|nr:hypothetical protein [Muribaculaceae bacterium]
MVDVYLFNPEHDLALAHGAHNYTAPPFARRFRHDLRLLQSWLATPRAFVAVPDDAPIDEDRRWLQDHRLDVTPIPMSQIADLGPCRIHPWGWDATLRHQLLQVCVSPDYLPTDEQLDRIRRLSHRRMTIKVHEALDNAFSPPPVELNKQEDVTAFMLAHPGCYLKMPWSGSGKGIYRVIDPMGDNHVPRWIDGALRRQGSLLCEEGLDRVQDFAIECMCRDGNVSLMGYSVFDSDFHSQFGTGRVAPMEDLHEMLLGLYPDLDPVIGQVLMAIDDRIAPHYDGPLGIDMMLYWDENGKIALNPCVEVNLRMTMGMVTAAMGSRHGLCGSFSIKTSGNRYLVSLST